jgi:hypothetical protein
MLNQVVVHAVEASGLQCNLVELGEAGQSGGRYD